MDPGRRGTISAGVHSERGTSALHQFHKRWPRLGVPKIFESLVSLRRSSSASLAINAFDDFAGSPCRFQPSAAPLDPRRACLAGSMTSRQNSNPPSRWHRLLAILSRLAVWHLIFHRQTSAYGSPCRRSVNASNKPSEPDAMPCFVTKAA